MAKPNSSDNQSNGSATQNGFSSIMDFSKFIPNGIPGFDMQGMIEAQRRNAEAFTQAGQRAMQNMQAIMQRQNEMVRESWQETSSLAAEVMAGGTPQEKMAKQTEVTKASIEKAVSNSRELTEMLTKCNIETAEALTSCFTGAMDTVRTACVRKA
ncbi:MAG: phasin family protein [Alphaproteobacteria bacterium]|nr:phasin family protein [Alphaproteobacteria bacterium]